MADRRLERSRTERRLAGVCGGLARYMDTDPVFVRLGFIAAALVPPFAAAAIIGYVAGWVIIPEEAEAPLKETPTGFAPAGSADTTGMAEPAEGEAARVPPGQGPPRRAPADAGLIGGIFFVALGVAFLLLNLGVIPWEFVRFWRWKILWPVAVIVLGVALLLRSLQQPRHGSDAS